MWVWHLKGREQKAGRGRKNPSWGCRSDKGETNPRGNLVAKTVDQRRFLCGNGQARWSCLYHPQSSAGAALEAKDDDTANGVTANGLSSDCSSKASVSWREITVNPRAAPVWNVNCECSTSNTQEASECQKMRDSIVWKYILMNLLFFEILILKGYF